MTGLIRIAAAGDVHVGEDASAFGAEVAGLAGRADVLLLAGDLTDHGRPAEARALADALRGAPLPVVAVLGNHDHDADRPDEVRALLQDAGVAVLEGEIAVLDVGGRRLGVAGVKGFGGGFRGACAADFGEREMKAFVRHGRERAAALAEALAALDADARVALLHYAPVEATLRGEPPALLPFLGSHLLADAVDATGAQLVLHGHAHLGAPEGLTPGGVAVRNVARP
ncbi:MAG TPA: metallophosphoesterase, partial [Miltoncostaeaceae bacterium]|nr:metallophosphoesterase [Miltoncostaeaceae bacterium]